MKLLEHFMKKNYKKLINKNVKWKGYVTSFNSWIDKKYLIKQVGLQRIKNEPIFSETV